jgi:uncharacterized protein
VTAKKVMFSVVIASLSHHTFALESNSPSGIAKLKPLEGIYVIANEVNHPHPSTTFEICQCQPGRCTVSYSNLGHHVCAFNGSIDFNDGHSANFTNGPCRMDFVFKNAGTVALSKTDGTANSCEQLLRKTGACGESGTIIGGTFQRRATVTPSFDCNAASNRREKAICSSPSLAELDRKISASFKEMSRQLRANNLVPESACQREWLQAVDHAMEQGCNKSLASNECLQGILDNRFYYLSNAQNCLVQQHALGILPLSDEVDLGNYNNRPLEDEEARSALNKVIRPNLQQRIPSRFWEAMNQPSRYMDTLYVKRVKDYVIFYRDGRTPFVIIISGRGSVWTIGSGLTNEDDRELVILSPQSGAPSLPQDLLDSMQSLYPEAEWTNAIYQPYYPNGMANLQHTVNANDPPENGPIASTKATLQFFCQKAIAQLCHRPLVPEMYLGDSTAMRETDTDSSQPINENNENNENNTTGPKLANPQPKTFPAQLDSGHNKPSISSPIILKYALATLLASFPVLLWCWFHAQINIWAQKISTDSFFQPFKTTLNSFFWIDLTLLAVSFFCYIFVFPRISPLTTHPPSWTREGVSVLIYSSFHFWHLQKRSIRPQATKVLLSIFAAAGGYFAVFCAFFIFFGLVYLLMATS